MPSGPDKMDSMFFVCIFIFVLVIFLSYWVFICFDICFGGRERVRKRDKKVG